MTLTGEIMQICEEGNRSFEGCQLDLGTPAMKIYSAGKPAYTRIMRARGRGRGRTQITYSQSPWERSDK